MKAVRGTEYPYCDELEAGVAAAKRITDKINEAQRRAENYYTVKNLETRVEDWKGHHISNFGALLLDDIFSVTKSEVDREYHVFLFEKIILCCKECPPPPMNGKKVGKSNSILKKPATPAPVSPGAGPSKQKSTPLLLKGRIFLNNVTQTVPKISAGQLHCCCHHTAIDALHAGTYSLAVWWRGDDDLEFFTLRCRNEEQLRLWENSLNKLIIETASRRNSEKSAQRQAQLATLVATRSHRSSNGQGGQTLSMSSQSPGSSSPITPGLPSGRSMRHPYAIDESSPTSTTPIPASLHIAHGNGPQGYPPHDGFDVDPEDDFEDYPPTSSLPPSGRGTPMGTRRPETSSGYPQARNSAHTLSSYSGHGVYPSSTGRPSVSRNTSSFVSDASSFGPGVVPSRGTLLRSQFSSTRLKSAYEQAESRMSSGSTLNGSATAPMRSRSASQPSAYVPHTIPPPLPTTAPWADRSHSALSHNKRGSGSSQSTGDSSDSSPHTSSSPITPYGSSESSLAGLPGADSLSAAVKVKVHFHEDIFVIQVPRSTEYTELVEKVGKKIRLCGPRRDDGPLRVKYKDEDGDLVSLGSTEDVQMAFESIRPGNQVTLFVQ